MPYEAKIRASHLHGKGRSTHPHETEVLLSRSNNRVENLRLATQSRPRSEGRNYNVPTLASRTLISCLAPFRAILCGAAPALFGRVGPCTREGSFTISARPYWLSAPEALLAALGQVSNWFQSSQN